MGPGEQTPRPGTWRGPAPRPRLCSLSGCPSVLGTAGPLWALDEWCPDGRGSDCASAQRPTEGSSRAAVHAVPPGHGSAQARELQPRRSEVRSREPRKGPAVVWHCRWRSWEVAPTCFRIPRNMADPQGRPPGAGSPGSLRHGSADPRQGGASRPSPGPSPAQTVTAGRWPCRLTCPSPWEAAGIPARRASASPGTCRP